MGLKFSSSNKTTTRNTVPCPSPNNLPPLTFHQIHGDHVRISHERRLAKRVESFCKGITFSARPVRINERVCVKFSEISNNWSGVIRFGFTVVDPVTMRHNLPKYACPDLTNKTGFWIKALNETYCERDNILFYYVTSAGDVHFGINGEEKGVFISGIETRSPLWTIIDIYGNCTAVEFLDYRTQSVSHTNNSSSSRNQYPAQAQQQLQSAAPHCQSMMMPAVSYRSVESNGSGSLLRGSGQHLDTDVDRIVPAFQNMAVQNSHNHNELNQGLPSIRFLPYGPLSQLTPMPFHRTKGRNVYVSQNRCIATRSDNEFCQGYVFTARPLRIGETLIIQILRTDHVYVGALALGLTSCDPSNLSPLDLPDDSDLLLDRPEYWVVSKDVASAPNTGDEISFCVTPTGEVTIRKNGGPPTTVMHVDQSLELYAFLDVYGSTQSVRVMSQAPLAHPLASTSSQQYLNAPPNASQLSLASCSSGSASVHNQANAASASANTVQRMPMSPQRLQVQMPTVEPTTATIVPPAALDQRTSYYQVNQVQTSLQQQPQQIAQRMSTSVPAQNNGRMAILMVNLPPDLMSNTATNAVPQSAQILSPRSAALASTGSLQSNGQYIEPFTLPGSSQPPMASASECTICYENPIDSVLYMCGHMCMCYECAVQQWRGIGGGHCPLCRAPIQDVIRTYKS